MEAQEVQVYWPQRQVRMLPVPLLLSEEGRTRLVATLLSMEVTPVVSVLRSVAETVEGGGELWPPLSELAMFLARSPVAYPYWR